jgi:hypothetical protein
MNRNYSRETLIGKLEQLRAIKRDDDIKLSI